MDLNAYDVAPVGARDGPSSSTSAVRKSVRPVLGAKQAVEDGVARASEAKDPERMDRAVEHVNETVQSLVGTDRRLHFRVDGDAGVVVATLTDGQSEEVVRQIPSEEFLDVAARLRELGSLLLDRVG